MNGLIHFWLRGKFRGITGTLLLLSVLVTLLVIACSDSETRPTEAVAVKALALTADQEAVLGFERPTTDWSASSGTLGESSTVSQGTKSLSIRPNGSTEVTSVPLSALGPVKSTFTVDLRVPVTPSWGDVRVVFVAPSLGLYWADLGSQSIAGLSTGTYHTLSFAVPPNLESALEGAYTDLRIKVILNAAPSSTPYLFDNIDFADVSGGGEPPPGTVHELSLLVPEGQTRESTLLSATEYLLGAQGVELASAGQLANVASFGTQGSAFGASLRGHANFYSQGDVTLNSQTIVEGFVRTAGSVEPQDSSVTIQGLTLEATPVPSQLIRWAVEFPGSAAALPLVSSSNPTLNLTPGAYQALTVHQGGTAHLQEGTYFFDNITVESGGKIVVHNTSSQLFIYVKNALILRGPVEDNGPRVGQVLFGYLGTSNAILKGPFSGTLVAPSATIELQRPDGPKHRGSWFGKRIQVDSNCHLVWLPFDWASLPPTPQVCINDDTCPEGQVCWFEQGPRFNLPHGSSVCVDLEECLISPNPDCGTPDSACGYHCSNDPRPCEDSCRPGEVCGGSNGANFGDPDGSYCWVPDCTDPEYFASHCGEVTSECGSCDPIGVPCFAESDCPEAQTCRADLCVDEACLHSPQLVGCGYPRARCGPCTTSPTCETDADCENGFCPAESNGEDFGTPGVTYCVTGDTCNPSCTGKQCGDADLGDGCGSRCNGLCADRVPGCYSDADCQAGSACINGGGARIGLAANVNVCMPVRCREPGLREPECGSTSAPCGICPALTDIACAARFCGADPVTGESCGECSGGAVCTPAGLCAPSSTTPPISVTNPDGSSRVVTPPVSPPPVGGLGAIPGEFSVSDRGSATYVIPIAVPPGRAGIEPRLSLRYSSSTGNGALGVGFSLDGLSTIRRCPRTYAQDGYAAPINDDDPNGPFCLDGQRLVPVPTSGPYQEFRTEVDSFTKVQRLFNEDHDYFWAFTKDGRILYFGDTPDSREVAVVRRRAYALSAIKDRFGNQVTIRYRSFTQGRIGGSLSEDYRVELLPDSITYTDHWNNGALVSGDRSLKFHYGDDRPDKLFGSQPGGGMFARVLRLDRIEISASHQPIRNYVLQYEVAPNGFTRMASLMECNGSRAFCKTPTTFSYFDESGFESGERMPLKSTYPYVPSPSDFRPFGTVVRRGANADISADVLAGINNLATTWVETPFPAGADLAVSMFGTGGALAAAYIRVVNFFGKREKQKDYYSPWFYSPVHGPDVLGLGFALSSTNLFDRDTCPDGQMPREHLLRTLRGDDLFHQTCPERTSEFIYYWPREWFPDLNGDGVQDKVYCAPPDGEFSDLLAYKLSSNGVVPTTATFAERDGEIEAKELCRLECAPGREVLCQAQEPSTFTFDFNGDGAGEVLFHESSPNANGRYDWLALGFDGASLQWRTLTNEHGSANLDGYYVTILDKNGDGLRDILALPDPKLMNELRFWNGAPAEHPEGVTWLNTGRGLIMDSVYMVPNDPDPSLARAPYYTGYVMDLDRDGREELVHPNNSASNTSTYQPWIVRRIPFNIIRGEAVTGSPRYPGTIGDFDGDGNPDILSQVPGDRAMLLYRGRGRRQNALKSVTDGLGRHFEVHYDTRDAAGKAVVQQSLPYGGDDSLDLTICRWPTRCMASVDHLVVSSYRQGHFAGPVLHWDEEREYKYARPIGDAGGLGWLGFLRRDISVFDGIHTLKKQTSVEYRIPEHSLPEAPWSAPYTRTLVGLPKRIVVSTPPLSEVPSPAPALAVPGGHEEVVTTFDWQEQLSTAGRPFPVLKQKKREVFSVSVPGQSAWTTQQLSTRVEDYITDAFGNQTDATVAEYDLEASPNPGPIAGSVNLTHVTTDYDPTLVEIENWIINRPKSIGITSQSAPPTCLPWESSCSEPPVQTQTRHAVLMHDPTTGFLNSVTREPGDPSLELTTVYTPDGYGNIEAVTSTDALGESRATMIDFDERRLFPISITNAKDQTTEVRYDDRFGTLNVSVDANGIDQTFSYDDFGVLRIAHGPGGDRSIDYEPAAPHYGLVQVAAAYRTIENQQGGETIRSEFNALNQLVERRVTGLNGDEVVEELQYNHRNLLNYGTRPHLEGDSTQGLYTYSYDTHDRLTEIAKPNGDHERFSYANWAELLPEYRALLTPGTIRVVAAFDGNDHVTISSLDRAGRAVATTDALGQTTRYLRGPLGFLQGIAGPSGVQLTYEPDAYGRVLAATDPAFGGTTELTYNGFDEVIRKRDPLGRDSILTYDVLGRLELIDDADGYTSFIYDGPGANQIGRLTESISPTDQHTVYAYEPPSAGRNRGLLESITQTLALPEPTSGAMPRELVTRFHFDDDARLAQIDYPGTTPAGIPFSVKYGFDDYGHAIRITDPSETTDYWQVTATHQGIRIATEEFGDGSITQRDYETFTGRLSGISTEKGAAVLQNQTYTYDPAGNLETRTFPITGSIETFDYDPIDRLRFVRDPVGTALREYRYDSAEGRLSYQSGVGDYSYHPAGRDWIASAGTTTYQPDALGRVHTRTGGAIPGGTQTFEYTTFDLPSRIESGSGPAGLVTYLGYDAGGTRVVKQAPAETTYYAGKHYTATVAPDDSVLHRYTIYAAGRAVAQASQTEANGAFTALTVDYYHDDLLGSVGTITHSDDPTNTTRSFTPFGQVDLTSSLIDTPFGFTGHEHDGDLGLINMNGRMYDPELGQFLSPDPYLQQPYGQGLNRYAYVNNNPLNLIDPSGFATEDNLDGDLTAGAIVGGHVTAGALIACGFGACGGGAAAIAGSGAATAAATGGGAAASGLGPATGLTTGVASFIGGVASVATSFLDMEYNFTGTYSDTAQSSTTVPGSKSAHASGGGTPNVGRVVNNAIAPVTEVPPELSLFNTDAIACAPCGRIFQIARQAGPIIAQEVKASWRWWAYQGQRAIDAATPIVQRAGTAVSRLFSSRVVPELGSKLDYFLGRATGSAHNVQRSTQMLRQLERVGLSDSAGTRQYLSDHLTDVVNNPSNIARVQENGRIVRESLLMGPRGGVKFETVWEGSKLITGNIFGGP